MRARRTTFRKRLAALLSPRRFWRDESGQGIIFAAASLIVLVGFVAYGLWAAVSSMTSGMNMGA